MLRPMQRWCLALAALALGCDVKEGPPTMRHEAALPCRSASDCASGSCLAAEGICNSPSGTLDTVLFEIAPQTTDQEYGSAHYFSYVQNLSRSSPDPLVLNIPDRVLVQGQVDGTPEQDPCTREGNSLPVTLVFTPREHLWGLSVTSYSFETTFEEEPINEFRFSGALPPGRYDVYMRPRSGRPLPTSCNLAPQIFRDISVGLPDTPAQPFTPVQRSLKLTMDWKEDLEGWTADMVHPITGEVISTRSTLQRINVVDSGDGPEINFTLYYSVGGEKDFIPEGKELVRLTPPPPPPEQAVTKGTVLLQREGLDLVTPGEGTIGDVTSFGNPIRYQSWVWRFGAYDSPVVGTVSYAATSLSEYVGGVDASFTGSARVDERGQVELLLLPGDYRMRVVPSPDEGLAASDQMINVSASASPQEGRVLPVPYAAQLEGNVLTSDTGAPIAGVEVVLAASTQPLDGCTPGVPSLDPLCARPRAEVLQRALGEDPFVPRARTTLTQGDGSFKVDEIDCGACEPGDGVGFDLVLRPPSESGLPWVLKPRLRVDGDTPLGTLQVPAPVTRPIRVTFGDSTSEVNVLPGALVTAYVLLDANSQPIKDPQSVPPCLGATAEDPVCIQSAVAIAEGRSDPFGELLLLLPPSLE
jgi:hypothetical protein